MKNLRRFPLLGTAALLLFATFVPALAATIRYVGADTSASGGWRTSTVSKPHDLDFDNILGTDGYHFVNLSPALPLYVSSSAILTDTYSGNEDYAKLDDPTDPGEHFVTGTMNPFPGTGSSADLFQFTVNSNAVGKTIRVGLLVDNLDFADYNASGMELLELGGGTSGVVSNTSAVFNDRDPDWLFFDITGATNGSSFIVRGVGGNNGAATLGGVAFDSKNFDIFPGTFDVSLALIKQGPSELISLKTNIFGTKTNVVRKYRTELTNLTFNAQSLLKLVQNSYNTTFPADAKLIENFGQFYVVDKTGTNVLLPLAPTLTVTFDSGEVVSGILKNSTTIKGGKTTVSVNDVENHKSVVHLNYDDTALMPADGKHTVFTLDGRRSSTTIVAGTHSAGTYSTIYKVSGNGSLRDSPTIFKGTISDILKVTEFW